MKTTLQLSTVYLLGDSLLRRLGLFFVLACCLSVMSVVASGQTLVDSFSDGEFNSNPAWNGDLTGWEVVANSTSSTNATGSQTLHLNATSPSTSDYLSTVIGTWGNAQVWGFWLGRRSGTVYATGNQVRIWLYANEANLESLTVDGYRLVIGDDVGGDEIVLEVVTNGVGVPILTSTGSLATGISDVGFLIRVTRSASGEFSLFTSALPTTNGTGAIATDVPNAANTTVFQGSATNTTYTPTTNGSLGIVSIHTTGASALTSVEFDQVYMTPFSITSVELSSFTSTSTANGTLLQWRTGYEVDSLGFNLYREKKGKRTRVNPSLIAGSAFLAGPRTAMTAGDSYAWFDPAGTSDSIYYLEDIDLHGKRTLHGPIVPVISTSASIRPELRQATLLSQLNSQSATTDSPSIWQQGWPALNGNGRELLYDIDDKASARLQELIASQQAAKISVNKEGWYRVTQADLAAAGFNTKIDPRFLQLYSGGMEVPILMNISKHGQFSAGDSFEFYGTGLNSPSTDTNTYWLIAGGGKGLRITPQTPQAVITTEGLSNKSQQSASQVNNGRSLDTQVLPSSVPANPSVQPQPNRQGWFIAPLIISPPSRESSQPQKSENSVQQTAPAQDGGSIDTSTQSSRKKPRKAKRRARKPRNTTPLRNHAIRALAPSQSYPYTVELKERIIYASGLLNGETENFYGQAITVAPVAQHLYLTGVNQTLSGQAQLQIALQGLTVVNHQVKVKVNGQEVGTLAFAKQEHVVAQFAVPYSALHDGDNTVTLERSSGDAADVSLVDFVRLTFERSYRADGNVLYFTAQGSTRIEGFTNGNIRVMDISDPFRVKELPCKVEPISGGFAATVPAPGEGEYLAFTDEQVMRPASIELDKPSNLKSSDNVADLVIISYGDFKDSVLPLAQLRQSQGLKVTVIDVQDIYDEFGYGAHGPHAIKDFLSWANTNWQKAPQYVLLVGDAGIDPRNYLGNGITDFVPTKLVDTSTMETASDNWLVDFNNDGLAEMAVGRLPVRTVAEANQVVAKIVNYKSDEALQQVLLVVDKNNSTDTFSFTQAGQELGSLLPPTLTANTISRAASSDDAIHSQVVNAINQGPLVVNYIGHGSVEVWTGASILSNADLNALNNSNHLPVFVMMTCLNGYFPNPARESLSEALLRNNSNGAVAVWASSGMTVPNSQSLLNQQFYRLLFGNGGMTLGEAAEKAKESVTDMDVRKTWILFGDPTMKLH